MSKPQAIAGVSSQQERIVAVTYPSIAGGGLGKALGWLYESIPIGTNSVKLSHLLFPLPLAPLTMLMYLWGKAFGRTYEITNRHVRIWQMTFGTRARLAGEVDLKQIADVAVDQQKGQVFFAAADLHLVGPDGGTRLVLPGVVCPDSFRATILKASDARQQTDAALATIQSRRPA